MGSYIISIKNKFDKDKDYYLHIVICKDTHFQ